MKRNYVMYSLLLLFYLSTYGSLFAEVKIIAIVHPDSLVCRGGPSEFIDQFNNLLKKLRDSGRLKSLLGDNFIAE